MRVFSSAAASFDVSIMAKAFSSERDKNCNACPNLSHIVIRLVAETFSFDLISLAPSAGTYTQWANSSAFVRF